MACAWDERRADVEERVEHDRVVLLPRHNVGLLGGIDISERQIAPGANVAQCWVVRQCRDILSSCDKQDIGPQVLQLHRRRKHVTFQTDQANQLDTMCIKGQSGKRSHLCCMSQQGDKSGQCWCIHSLMCGGNIQYC